MIITLICISGVLFIPFGIQQSFCLLTSFEPACVPCSSALPSSFRSTSSPCSSNSHRVMGHWMLPFDFFLSCSSWFSSPWPTERSWARKVTTRPGTLGHRSSSSLDLCSCIPLMRIRVRPRFTHIRSYSQPERDALCRSGSSLPRLLSHVRRWLPLRYVFLNLMETRHS